jgi:hypothetical protein
MINKSPCEFIRRAQYIIPKLLHNYYIKEFVLVNSILGQFSILGQLKVEINVRNVVIEEKKRGMGYASR